MAAKRVLWLAGVLGLLALAAAGAAAQGFDASPPDRPVKLIFIHHSCGENWLADEDGGLGQALAENNYFVSDTNYGWGPEGIGDRTDITDWPEWFTGPNSGQYLAALYDESGQNSWYSRTMADPGGENQVIMFKSCYPNSNLEGNPDDPPRREEGLTVANAKAIYNELLGYFATRPDKLFVAVTAPPVQDSSYADNARAFNNWLVNDWLDGYDGSNVAVFDFYNVLTGRDNHHRFQGSYIEHVWGANNTLVYPSDDDHPAPAGNRKATDEFVPLLNVWVNGWLAGAPVAQPEVVPTAGAAATVVALPAETPELVVAEPLIGSGVIDDFESDARVWEAFADSETETQLTCGRAEGDSYSGSAGLRIDYEVAPDGWANCSLVLPEPVDWTAGQGLALYLRAGQAGQPVTVVAYQRDQAGELLVFELNTTTSQEAVDGWQRVDIAWGALRQPEWQGDPDVPFDPSQAAGLALAFNEPGAGTLWVDDVSFLAAVPGAVPQAELYVPAVGAEAGATAAPPAYPAPATEATAPPVAEEDEPAEAEEGGGLCRGALALGGLALAVTVGSHRKARAK